MRGSDGGNVRIEGIGLKPSARFVFDVGEEDVTLENPADGAPPLVAAPRHLRRRRLHGEIPDALLVPGAEPFPLSVERPASAKRAAELDVDADEVAYSRKRLAALLAVIFVAVSVPALIVVLLLLG
jgi:hypothetical protein